MAFLCPECSSYSLKITLKIELPPDSRSDEITLQVIKCTQCDFQGIAVYEESRRGRLDSESFSHTGYLVSKADVSALKKMIRQCPAPRDKRCDCQVHRQLGRKDIGGRWAGLVDIDTTGIFQLER
ncbi:MAG: hypothetical protein JXA42_15275 [Anaerolineales bacterium]|nr:hypothetical protein [Anaerolineales bacterium]